MYEKFFQLRERPFALSPDPEYLYPSKVHQEALSYLRYGIEGHAGFVVITGEIGSGKTTMLQSLLGRLDSTTAVARIVNTLLDPRELLESIMLDFGIDPTGMSKPVLLHRLAGFLVQQRQAGRLTLLVIDEAQNLSLPTLEEIRMLSNLETEKSKLLQIVLIGQPELRDTLALPKLEQLRQRITVSYHLPPLDAEETAKYINHRLKRAAIGAPLEFPRQVSNLIHARSRGVPRVINVIADATLLFAYGLDRHDIDVAIAQEALAELDASGVLTSTASTEADDTMSAPAAPVPVGKVLPEPATQVAVGRVVSDPAGQAPTTHVRSTAAPAAPPLPVTTPTTSEAVAPQTTAVIAPPPAVTMPAAAQYKAPAPPAARPAAAPAPLATAAAAAPLPQRRMSPPSPNRILAPTVMPNGVRVQRFEPPPAPATLWHRLRRAVLGVFQTGA